MTGDAFLSDLVSFGRLLREAGAEVGPGRIADAVRALDAVGLDDSRDVYFALRQALVSHRDELELFDRAFSEWVKGRADLPQRELPTATSSLRASRPSADGGEVGAEGAEESKALGASAVEVLRRRDFASLDEAELADLRRLLSDIGRVRPRRTSRRLRPHARGEQLDLRRLVRRSLRSGGELVELPSRTRKVVPRKLVVLCDVSGSMAPYARALLLFLHATAQAGRVEAFAFGTRLARLTPDLATRDPELALARVTAQVVDWGSGTRIGGSLKQFNDEYGRRALTRGAVVVVASDGWERDDPAVLSREMARLSRAAYSVVWLNPLKGTPGYEPLAQGMRAALPYVDRFLPGHNLESLEGLAGVVAGIERRHAA
ncbi:MAG TPA: VWA domain-containing protein [Gaiellaceae bacterium]|nr:VWA domain-containing protein [Gaiellaceae bacterium]